MKSVHFDHSRRRFLFAAAGTVGVVGTIFKAGTIETVSAEETSPDKGTRAVSPPAMIPYAANLGDRLWMWGHGAGSTDSLYNIPKGHQIDEADAIRSMGIPGVCVTRWLGLPKPENESRDGKKPPFDEFIKQMADVKRVAWSIVDGAPEPFELKKEWAFSLLEKLPNLTTLFLDDYFIGDAVPKKPGEPSPASLSLERLAQLRGEAAALPRRPDIAAVLYSNQLRPEIKPHLDLCDVVSFWTWKATDLVNMESNFRRYREILPKKPTLLGVYMWDFGNGRPVTSELMEHQLATGLNLFRNGEIEGMIFHCTPLCDLGLAAVERSRQWIAEHKNDIRG